MGSSQWAGDQRNRRSVGRKSEDQMIKRRADARGATYYSPLPTAHSLLPIAHCPLPTAHQISRIRATSLQSGKWGQWIQSFQIF